MSEQTQSLEEIEARIQQLSDERQKVVDELMLLQPQLSNRDVRDSSGRRIRDTEYHQWRNNMVARISKLQRRAAAIKQELKPLNVLRSRIESKQYVELRSGIAAEAVVSAELPVDAEDARTLLERQWVVMTELRQAFTAMVTTDAGGAPYYVLTNGGRQPMPPDVATNVTRARKALESYDRFMNARTAPDHR